MEKRTYEQWKEERLEERERRGREEEAKQERVTTVGQRLRRKTSGVVAKAVPKAQMWMVEGMAALRVGRRLTGKQTVAMAKPIAAPPAAPGG